MWEMCLGAGYVDEASENIIRHTSPLFNAVSDFHNFVRNHAAYDRHRNLRDPPGNLKPTIYAKVMLQAMSFHQLELDMNSPESLSFVRFAMDARLLYRECPQYILDDRS